MRVRASQEATKIYLLIRNDMLSEMRVCLERGIITRRRETKGNVNEFCDMTTRGERVTKIKNKV